MHLETEKGVLINDPSDSTIAETLAGLDGAANSFAVLNADDAGTTYIQAAGGPTSFAVEYREGDRHLRGEDDDLPLDTVVRMFQDYARGGQEWKGMVGWEDITREVGGRTSKAGCFPMLAGAIVAAAVLMVAAVWLAVSA